MTNQYKKLKIYLSWKTMSKISLFKTAKRLYFVFAALFLVVAGCNFPDPFFIPVTAIEDVPAAGTAGTPLVLTATVRPGFASNSDIVWLVVDAGTTGASVSRNVINATANGTVIIKAEIANGGEGGKDYTQFFTIVFSGSLQIAGITIKTQPSKLDYANGEALDLSGLAVTLAYNDGATEDVEYSQFASKGITAIPAHGTALSLSTHHDTAVLIKAGNYSAATNNLTITKAAGAAVGIPSASWNFASKTITVSAVTAPANGQSVEYAFSTLGAADPASLAWAVGKLTFTKDDDGIANDTTYYIYARSASNENYNAGTASISEGITTSATTVSVSGVTLDKTSASLTVGGTETLTQTVSPGNATNKIVTWSSSNTAVATVNSGMITAVSAGTAVITVKTADGNYTATCTVTVSLPSAADVTFPTATAITYGAALSTSILSGGSAGRGSFVWQTPLEIPTVNNSGYSVEFTPNDLAVNNYSGVVGWDSSKVIRTVSITVNKKSVTITPTAGQSKTYGAADPTFEYTPSEELISGNTFTGALAYTGTNVGTYPFMLGSLSAGDNYTLVLGGSVTFAITKAAGAAVGIPTVNGTPTSNSITVNVVTLQTATGQSIEYAISTVSGVTPTTEWQSGTVFSGLNANTTYYVYARSASNTNYNEGTANVSAEIKTALASAAEVTFPTAAAITYGAALSTSILSGGSAGRGSFVWQTPSTIPTVTNSSYLMEFTPNDSYNYSGVVGWDGSKVIRTVSITVNKKSVTITPTAGQSKTYGAADPTFEYTPSEELISGNTFSGALAYTGTNVGTYPFTLGTLNAGDNYTLVLGGNVTFAITKAAGAAVSTPTVSGSPTSDSITVNTVAAPGNGQTVEYAISTASNGTGLSAYQSGTVFTGLNANTTYYVYARSASSANYNEGTASVSAGIKTALPSAADVTFPTAAAITYGAALSTSTLSGGTTGRGTFVWQTPSTIPTVTNSSYSVEFTPNDAYDYSGITGWDGSKVVRTVAITVNKKSVTITPATGQSKTYGAADPTFTYTPSETLISGNTFTGALAYTGTNAGTYPFTLGTLSAGDNYTLVLGGNITFAITKAAGAAVTTPAVSTGTPPTYGSITVNTVAAPGNGQTVEYAISTANNGTGLSAYQSGTTFSGLTAGTTYYVYARSASNANYNEGTANVSAGITTTALEEITSEKGIVLVKIPAGTFTMGSPTTEPDRYTDETQHQVTLTKDFYMGKYEVTQEQYQAVIGSNPSDFKITVYGESETPGKLPVEMVTWYDAVEFCNKLSVLEGRTEVYTISERTPTTGYPITSATVTADWNKNGYRLPTEAEWEYACRAGTTIAWYTGNTEAGPPHLNTAAWYTNNAIVKTHQVGLKTTNAWGLYDMHGNVWEWCWDWYSSSYYSSSPDVDPEGAVSGASRVLRGGCFVNQANLVRSATRNGESLPSNRSNAIGFRLVRSAQ
jgi:formylglycine-generating enzyme required for sulfatase activity/uncharacterized protein YjdB